MKMAKRIFITLLVVTVMLSSFTVSASVVDYTVEDYANVLEYFEEEILLDYDFTADDAGEWELFTKNADQVEQSLIPTAEENSLVSKYLSVAVKGRESIVAYYDNHVYFGWSSDEGVGSFNVDMTVSGSVNASSAEQNLPKIIVTVGDSALESLDSVDLDNTIVAIDYKAGRFSYLKAVTDSEGNTVGQTYVTDYAIAADCWYSVSITYDVKNGASAVTVTNCADPSDTITVEDGFVPFTEVKDIRIGAHGSDTGTSRGTEMKFASLRVLGGVYHRDPSNKQADVEEKLISMYDMFNDNDSAIDDKIAICDIVAKIKGYGFTSEDPDVQKAIDELGVGAVALYNFRIASCVDVVDTLSTYAEKRALVDECLGYVEVLGMMDLTDTDPELLASLEENKQGLAAADEKLNGVEDETLRFIEAVNSYVNIDIYNYPVSKECSEYLSTYSPDPTYSEDAQDAYNFYSKATNACAAIKASGDKFVEAVSIASNTDLDINTRADAFRLLYDAYYNNETYPGVTEALATYEEIYDDLKAEIDCADNFIMYVGKADFAAYVTAKQENLDKALEYKDICNSDYRGVAEAKVLYDEIRAYIDQQIENAKAYIDAVNALDILNGDALTEGIKKALQLQQTGNVLGVEGVPEANIKLEKLIASMQLSDKYSEHFIRLVNSLDKASTAAEIYPILVEAKEAESYADQRHEGVSDASEKLQNAITDYNKTVQLANTAFETANDAAANTCGIGAVNTNTVKNRVIALIKKFFDEE